MNKILVFEKEARSKLAEGANILAKAVISTLGPRSRNVAINREYPAPLVVHDGVTVARNIFLKDPFQDMGAALLREAASKTNDLAGDGTTTATLLANVLVQEGLKIVEGGLQDEAFVTRMNPMELKEKLEVYSAKIISELEKKTIKLKNKDAIQQIATVSSQNEAIGSLVAEAVTKVGKDGLIMVEESPSFDSSLEYQEGMEFDNGFLSPYFITDGDRLVTEYQDSYIFLTDYTIADASLLVPLIEKVIQDGQNKKALLIIANDVVGPALQALVLTKLRTGAPLVAVMAPEYADRRKEMLQDISVLTGAKVFSMDTKDDIKEVKLADLGKARNIRVTQTHTLITPKSPDTDEIKERANSIKTQAATEKNPLRKSILEERLAKLTQSVAIIKVGGASQTEIHEKRERFIDAVHATKAALAEGIVLGGGIALLSIADSFKDDNGVGSLVKKALRAPFETIVKNAGFDSDKIEESRTIHTNLGFNVINGTWVDMKEAGIMDPVKVTKLAVKHAFSVASMILTTDVLITDEPEKDTQNMRIVNAQK